MCNTIASLIITGACLALLITSSIKYGIGKYEKCGLVFHGHIKQFDAVYLPNTTTEAIVAVVLDVYKVQDSVPRFIETYKAVTNLYNASKYKLKEYYANSTAVSLYKDCESRNLKEYSVYYFEDVIYFQGTVWQNLLAYSLVAFLISGFITGFWIYENCQKPSVIRYTSSDFHTTIHGDPLTESQTPTIRVWKDDL
jgi:hypothetical protein